LIYTGRKKPNIRAGDLIYFGGGLNCDSFTDGSIITDIRGPALCLEITHQRLLDSDFTGYLVLYRGSIKYIPSSLIVDFKTVQDANNKTL